MKILTKPLFWSNEVGIPLPPIFFLGQISCFPRVKSYLEFVRVILKNTQEVIKLSDGVCGEGTGYY